MGSGVFAVTHRAYGRTTLEERGSGMAVACPRLTSGCLSMSRIHRPSEQGDRPSVLIIADARRYMRREIIADGYVRVQHCDSAASCKDGPPMLSISQRSRASVAAPVAKHPGRKVPEIGRLCPSRMLRYRSITQAVN